MHYVEIGLATFELTRPDHSEWERRFGAVVEAGLPFVTATIDGEAVGNAYCRPWRARPAYRHTVEDEVYVASHAVGRGVGGKLLDTHCL